MRRESARLHVLTSMICALLVTTAGCATTSSRAESRSHPPVPTGTQLVESRVETAAAFVRRWVRVDRRMQNTGAVEEYRSLSSRCEDCMRVAERVEQMYADGGWVRTRGWTVLDLDDVTDSVGRTAFDLRIRSAPTRFKESADEPVQRMLGGVVVMRLRLTNYAPWGLVRMTQIPS